MIQQYDVVRLKRDIPEKGLVAGEEGTVLEPPVNGLCLVEFDAPGREDLVIEEVSERILTAVQPITA